MYLFVRWKAVMELQLIQCPDEEVFRYFRKMEEREYGDYLDGYVLNRPSAVFICMFYKGTWVGYALVESMKHLNVGMLLDDIWEEEEFERALEFVEKHLKENGYYLHVFEIFKPYQRKRLGTQAERSLMDVLQAPILLYTVAKSEYFWLKQGYESLDGEYYLYKIC